MKHFFQKKVLCATAALLVVVALAFFITKSLFPVLQIVNAETGEIYYKTTLQDRSFSVSYTHSVNKSTVEEYFQVRNGDIYLTKARQSAFGAGVATEVKEPQTLEYENGYMVMGNLNKYLPDLTYRVGTISNHQLHLGSGIIPLKTLAPQQEAVKFVIKE